MLLGPSRQHLRIYLCSVSRRGSVSRLRRSESGLAKGRQELLDRRPPCLGIASKDWVAIRLVRRKLNELPPTAVLCKSLEPAARKRRAPILVVLAVEPQRRDPRRGCVSGKEL